MTTVAPGRPLQPLRIFVSSTFDDFKVERDMLFDTVLPSANENFAEFGVAIECVDLRWGIRADEAESGLTLMRCLDAVDACRPFFIGLIGGRSGWRPGPESFSPQLLERHPWVAPHVGQVSATELEILHGVLNAAPGTTQALFFFRQPDFSAHAGLLPAFGGPVGPPEPDAFATELELLKQRIRDSGAEVVEAYADPGEFLAQAQDALTRMLTRQLGEPRRRRHQVRQDALNERRWRELAQRHQPRPAVQAALQRAVDAGDALVLLTGSEGSGKSSLLAAQAARLVAAGAQVFFHVAGLLSLEADARILVCRWHLWAQGLGADLPDYAPDLFEGNVAAQAHAVHVALAAHGEQHGTRCHVLLDDLQCLGQDGRLHWAPREASPRVVMVLATCDERQADALRLRPHHAVQVGAFERDTAEATARALLAHHHKSMASDLLLRLLGHRACQNAKGLTLCISELVIAASHDRLAQAVDTLADCQSLDDVYAKVLVRLEAIVAARDVADVLRVAALADEVLTPAMLSDLTGVPQGTLRVVLLALGDALTAESDMPLRLRSAALRRAVQARYLERASEVRGVHRWIASYLERLDRSGSPRYLRARLYHLVHAEDRQALRTLLSAEEMLVGDHAPDAESVYRGWRVCGVQCHADLCAMYRDLWQVWQKRESPAPRYQLACAIADFLGRFGLSDVGFPMALYQFALKGIEAAAGRQNQETVRTLRAVARLVREAGAAGQAVPLLEQALALARQIQGGRAIETAFVISDLAAALHAEGDLHRAEALYLDSLAITESVAPAAHSATLNNLGHLQLQTSRLQAAGVSFERALAVRLQHMTREHNDVAQCLMNLGHLAQCAGDLMTAEERIREALEIRERLLPSGHPDTGLARLGLGRLLIVLGRTAEAGACLQAALSDLQQHFPDEHAYVLEVQAALAVLARRP